METRRPRRVLGSLITKTRFGPDGKKLVAGGACPEPAERACPELAERACPELAERVDPELAERACPELAERVDPELAERVDPGSRPQRGRLQRKRCFLRRARRGRRASRSQPESDARTRCNAFRGYRNRRWRSPHQVIFSNSQPCRKREMFVLPYVRSL